MKKRLIDILKFLLFLSLGVGILYYLYYTQEAAFQADCASQTPPIPSEDCSFLEKLANDFRGVNYFWVGMVAFVFLLSNVSRSLRWVMLINSLGKKITFKNAFLATMTKYLINTFLPRVGEVAQCGIITRYEGVPMEKVLGTVVVDRVMDVLSLLVVIGLAFLLQFNVLWGYLSENALIGGEGGGIPSIIWILLGVGVLGLVTLFIFRKPLMRTKLYAKLEELFLGFWEGIQTIRNLERPWVFVGHSIFIWVMYFLMLYLAFFSFEPTAHLGPQVALVAFVFGAFGIVIPSPGGMGSYQFLVMTALSVFYGITKGDAFAFANIAFFAPFFSNIIFGFIAFILLPIANAGNKNVANVQ